MTNKYLEQLHQLDAKLSAYGYALELMGWDGLTLSPKKGVTGRSQAIGQLTDTYFKTFVNDQTKECLDNLSQNQNQLTGKDLAVYKAYQREYDKISKIPAKEYADYSMLKQRSNHAWEEAKEKNDFSLFEPLLDQMIETNRRFIDYRGYQGHPYNTLLDDYETDLTVEQADRFFNQLRQDLVPFINQLDLSANQPIDFPLFDTAKQKQLSHFFMKECGFRVDSGVLAESVHPFTLGLDRDDVRITTHYYEDNLFSSIFSTIHETGHAIYEQNINPDFGQSILSTGTTMGIHESQSRIYENNIGHSLAFWKHYYPVLIDTFPDVFGQLPLNSFYRYINRIDRSLIRIEADEVTYPLHIMVRYDLEKAIFSGQVKTKELPELWNSKYQEYLGIRPANDGEGILQDVHWSDGLFGYFPSYAIGSAYAAQFEHAINQSLDFNALLEKGQIAPIRQWLSDRIHVHGASKTPSELLQIATGEAFNPAYFTDYIIKKYSAIYR